MGMSKSRYAGSKIMNSKLDVTLDIARGSRRISIATGGGRTRYVSKKGMCIANHDDFDSFTCYPDDIHAKPVEGVSRESAKSGNW